MFRFGPANVLFSTQYDEAMKWFLTCLRDFVDFSVSLDKENDVPPDKSLKLPYKVRFSWNTSVLVSCTLHSHIRISTYAYDIPLCCNCT